MEKKNNVPLKVLMITDSIGHTRGYHLVSTALRDAGIEVILGGIQVPKEIASTAIQEDVDAIGYHVMCGDPAALAQALLEELRATGGQDITLILGGIIMPWHIDDLEAMGVAKVFLPGSTLESIATFFTQKLVVAQT